MVKLVFCIHNHQPVGNFDFVIEEAYQKSYLPFVETIKKFPDLKFTLHFTGILYDWFEKHKPEYMSLLKELVHSRQVELLSGGYYEPVTAAIPPEDARGQIRKMNNYLNSVFGITPRGLWLAERVWEPQAAGIIDDCKIDFTVLDDTHFLSAGVPESELTGCFAAEYNSKVTGVFPINKQLRYFIPFAVPEKTIEYLATFRGQGDVTLVMADDGEKFGLWPHTYKTVYEEKWLERFCNLIRNNSQWLSLTHFETEFDKKPLKSIAALGTGSYIEFNKWAAPVKMSEDLDDAKKHVSTHLQYLIRGGYFRNFTAKYPESNLMYQRANYVSQIIHNHCPGSTQALDHLWQSQCNCGYWHGVFGGLYLAHLRSANYANIINAQRIAETSLPKNRVEHLDFDCDNRNEVVVNTENGLWYFAPQKGGALYEWDVKNKARNYINCLTRREESYHKEVAKAHVSGSGAISPDAVASKQADLDKAIIYDWHRRGCLIDHFFGESASLDSYEKARYGEEGSFVTEHYNVSKETVTDSGVTLGLVRQGYIWHNGQKSSVIIDKTIVMNNDGSWKAEYEITNNETHELNIWFGVENTVSFMLPETCQRLDEQNVTGKTFKDYDSEITFKFSRALNLWAFPLKTVNMSEGGFELVYQGTVFTMHEKLKLLPGETKKFALEFLAK